MNQKEDIMKRIIAAVIAMVLVATVSLSAFAAKGFNMSVFDTAQDVIVDVDDMTGKATIVTESLLGSDGEISVGYGETVAVYGGIVATEDSELCAIIIQYYANNWAFIDSAIVKVGNKRYKFTDLSNNKDVCSDATIRESVDITVMSDVIPFMQDLITHRNEEIKVRLCGSEKDVDFILTDKIKDSLINLYNLYVAAGGTRKSNMKIMDRSRRMKVKVTEL